MDEAWGFSVNHLKFELPTTEVSSAPLPFLYVAAQQLAFVETSYSLLDTRPLSRDGHNHVIHRFHVIFLPSMAMPA